ncbi:hypothetical protein [Streptomyces sp. NPDC047453]|uniref:hypothetical protein n=1 Tax=Streptomyces sp. NPDC047453 TaxID=3154812 RepID=UPI00340EF326
MTPRRRGLHDENFDPPSTRTHGRDRPTTDAGGARWANRAATSRSPGSDSATPARGPEQLVYETAPVGSSPNRPAEDVLVGDRGYPAGRFGAGVCAAAARRCTPRRARAGPARVASETVAAKTRHADRPVVADQEGPQDPVAIA